MTCSQSAQEPHVMSHDQLDMSGRTRGGQPYSCESMHAHILLLTMSSHYVGQALSGLNAFN